MSRVALDSVALPEIIAVRFTEEEAGYLSLRPVRRQSFRLAELTDMILSVTGRDAERVEKIFRAGAVTYNGYRYLWQGFSAGPGEIAALLAPFPENDPARPFRSQEATSVLLEFGEKSVRAPVELTKAEADVRRLLRVRSLWELLMQISARSLPVYERYSYALRADLYRRALSVAEAKGLMQGLLSAAPRGLRQRLINLPLPQAIVFQCPRGAIGAGPAS